MTIRGLVVCGVITFGLIAAGSLAGCGKSSDIPPPFNQNLASSGAVAALPIAGATVDRGILKDQAGYQAAGGGSRAGGMTGSEREQVQALVEKLIKAVSGSDAEAVLAALVPDDAAALKDQSDTLFATREKQQLLETTLIGKFGKDAVTQFDEAESKKLTDALRIEVQDADNATVTPNILAQFFGPTKGAAATAVKRVDGNWKVSLGLTADDAKQIAAFHHLMQAAVDVLIKQIESGELTALDQLPAAAAKAVVGAVTGGAAEGVEKPAKPADTADKPKEAEEKPAAESQPSEEKKPDGEEESRDPRRRPPPEDEPPPRPHP